MFLVMRVAIAADAQFHRTLFGFNTLAPYLFSVLTSKNSF